MCPSSAGPASGARSRPRELDPARREKRDRILRSAVRIFADKGFPSARISDIARDAGVADGTVYLYFKGKDDLLLSIFQEGMARFLEEGKRLAGESIAPAERLRRLVALHLRALGGDRDLAAVCQIEMRGSRKALTLLSSDRLVEYFGLLASLIAEGQQSGQFRPDVRPRMAAGILWGAVDEVVTHWVLAEKPSDLELAGRVAVDIFLRGIAAAPEGRG